MRGRGKGPFKITLIKTRFLRLLLFPSLICLDAPLAVAGWAFVLAASRGDGREVPPAAEAVALFAAVWAIYLGDRLHDARRAGRGAGDENGASIPLRHAWAREHPRILAISLGVALLAGIVVMPFLSATTWSAAGVVAVATVVYFFVFRGRWMAAAGHCGLPVKELAIAFCFTAGAAIAAALGSIATIPLACVASLVFLVLGNCLLISRREAAHDAREDPAAYYSGGKGRPLLPEIALGIAFGLALISLEHEGVTPAVVALMTISGLTFLLARARHPGIAMHTQALADGLHLLTWVLVFWV